MSFFEIEPRSAFSAETPPQLMPFTPPQQRTPPSRRSHPHPHPSTGTPPQRTPRAGSPAGCALSGSAAPPTSKAAGASAATAPLHVSEDAEGFMVEGRRGGENFSVRLCRASGGLKALRVGGATVLEEGGTLCTWRAPTDNDEACAFSAITRPIEDSFAAMPLRYRIGAWVGTRLPLCCLGPLQVLATCGVVSEELIAFASWARMWRSEGWHDPRRRVISLDLLSAEPSCVTLRATVELRAPGGCWLPLARWCIAPRATHRLTMSVLAHGEILLANEARCRSELASLPRLGLQLELPASLDHAEWYGHGPHEN